MFKRQCHAKDSNSVQKPFYLFPIIMHILIYYILYHPVLDNPYSGSDGDLCLLLILNQLVTKVQVHIPVILPTITNRYMTLNTMPQSGKCDPTTMTFLP